MINNSDRRGILAQMRLARLNAEIMGHELGRWARHSPNLHATRCQRCRSRVFVSPQRFSGHTPIFPCVARSNFVRSADGLTV